MDIQERMKIQHEAEAKERQDFLSCYNEAVKDAIERLNEFNEGSEINKIFKGYPVRFRVCAGGLFCEYFSPPNCEYGHIEYYDNKGKKIYDWEHRVAATTLKILAEQDNRFLDEIKTRKRQIEILSEMEQEIEPKNIYVKRLIDLIRSGIDENTRLRVKHLLRRLYDASPEKVNIPKINKYEASKIKILKHLLNLAKDERKHFNLDILFSCFEYGRFIDELYELDDKILRESGIENCSMKFDAQTGVTLIEQLHIVKYGFDIERETKERKSSDEIEI